MRARHGSDGSFSECSSSLHNNSAMAKRAMANNSSALTEYRWTPAPCGEPARGLPLELRRNIAIAVAIALNIIAAAMITSLVERGIFKSQASPLAFTRYAQAMAYCSLSAIWAARAQWPSHLRMLAAFML